MTTLCELIGEELFEARLVMIEEDSIDGNFIKSQKTTNEYEPQGIVRRIIETKVCNAETKHIIQEGVEQSEFENDEYGNILLEKISIDCGLVDSIQRNQIKYRTVYDQRNRIAIKTKEGSNKQTCLRTSYMYDNVGNIQTVIFDEINAKGNTTKNMGNTKICDIIRDEYNVTKVIVTKIDHKKVEYDQGIYTFDYNINTGMLSTISLQQPIGTRNMETEEYVGTEDEYITIVSGLTDQDGLLIRRKVLKFRRY